MQLLQCFLRELRAQWLGCMRCYVVSSASAGSAHRKSQPATTEPLSSTGMQTSSKELHINAQGIIYYLAHKGRASSKGQITISQHTLLSQNNLMAR